MPDKFGQFKFVDKSYLVEKERGLTYHPQVNFGNERRTKNIESNINTFEQSIANEVVERFIGTAPIGI